MSSPDFFHFDYDHNPTSVGVGIEYYLRDAHVNDLFHGPIMPTAEEVSKFNADHTQILDASISQDNRKVTIHNKLTDTTIQFENNDKDPDIEQFRIIDNERDSLWLVSDSEQKDAKPSDGRWSSIMKFEDLSSKTINDILGNQSNWWQNIGNTLRSANKINWTSSLDNGVYDSTNSKDGLLKDTDNDGDFDTKFISTLFVNLHYTIPHNLELKNQNFVEDSTSDISETINKIQSLNIDGSWVNYNNGAHLPDTNVLDKYLPVQKNEPTNIKLVLRNYLHEGYIEHIDGLIHLIEQRGIELKPDMDEWYKDLLQYFYNQNFGSKYEVLYQNPDKEYRPNYDTTPNRLFKVYNRATHEELYEVAITDINDQKMIYVYTPNVNYVYSNFANSNGTNTETNITRDNTFDTIQIYDKMKNISYMLSDQDNNKTTNTIWMRDGSDNNDIRVQSDIDIKNKGIHTFDLNWNTMPNSNLFEDLYYHDIKNQDNNFILYDRNRDGVIQIEKSSTFGGVYKEEHNISNIDFSSPDSANLLKEKVK